MRVSTIWTHKKLAGVLEVTETITLVAQVSQIHQMMKNMMTSPETTTTELVKVVTDASEVVCVYYGGAHMYEDCSANPVSVNYVGNNKYNNPYSNTYNPGWRNHLNLS